MKKTGRETPSLTAQLHEKTQAQRSELEALMQQELQRLARNLRQSSTVALNGIERDIQSQLIEIHKSVSARRQWIKDDLTEIRERPKRWILISAATAALVTSLTVGAPMLWTIWRLHPVTVEQNESGTFLILPPAAQTGWRCGDQPCVKLED